MLDDRRKCSRHYDIGRDRANHKKGTVPNKFSCLEYLVCQSNFCRFVLTVLMLSNALYFVCENALNINVVYVVPGIFAT